METQQLEERLSHLERICSKQTRKTDISTTVTNIHSQLASLASRNEQIDKFLSLYSFLDLKSDPFIPQLDSESMLQYILSSSLDIESLEEQLNELDLLKDQVDLNQLPNRCFA